LLRRIERHLSRTGMRPTTLGRLALGDPLLVAELRRGRVLRPRTQARVNAYLDRAEQTSGGKR
jgi:hypothetical protein